MKWMFHAISYIMKSLSSHCIHTYFLKENKSINERSSCNGTTVEANLKKDLVSIICTLIGIKACPTHKFQNTDQYKYQFVYKINDIELNVLDKHLT